MVLLSPTMRAQVMVSKSPLPAHIVLWYRTQDTHRQEKPGQARGRDVNIGAWSFVVCAAGSLVTVVLGVPWTTYIALRHTPPAVWSTPLFRETNVVMTLGWTFIFLAAAGVVAWTPLWVQPIVGVSLYGLGRASPCLAARYAARRARDLG